jgi:hypothetical protein
MHHIEDLAPPYRADFPTNAHVSPLFALLCIAT